MDFFIFNRLDVYDDTNNLCKFHKNWIKMWTLSYKQEKKLAKFEMVPFPIMFDRFFFIFKC